jgi:hypothetical protein
MTHSLRRWMIAFAAIALMAAVAGPAHADDDDWGWRGRGYEHHHEWREHYRREEWREHHRYWRGRPGAAVIVAPPVYVPPVVYSPPPAAINLVLPLFR